MPDSVPPTFLRRGKVRGPAGSVDELREIILRSDQLVDRISQVIADSLVTQVSVSGESVAKAIAPIIARAIRIQALESPQEIVDALYPIVGAAIRRALAEAALGLPGAPFRWMRRALAAAGRPFAAISLQRVKPAIITGLILLPLLLIYGWWLRDGGSLLAAAPAAAPSPVVTAASVPPTSYPAPVPGVVDLLTAIPTFTASPVSIAGSTESPVTPDTATPTVPTPTPTDGPTPTATPTFTPLPTARPLPRVVLAGVTRTPNATTAATAIPTAVPTAWVPESTINILLLGSDQRPDQDDWRTDVMIVVSINLDGPSAAMLSIPRDLYVWVPDWRMARINSVDTHGYAVGYPGSGPGLLKQTLLYNLGIPVHYYARVDFDGFVRIMDALGGVEVPVTCPMTDWRLRSPELDPEEEDNWELFTVDQRVNHMDGDLALWYARSRQRTSDFDRSRRQQRLLRALLAKSMDAELILQLPRLWSKLSDAVETDLGLGEIMQLAAAVPQLDLSKIKSRFVAGTAVLGWTNPETEASVLLPQAERISELVWDLLEPPAMNRAFQDPPVVEVWNGTLMPEIDLLAVDNLAWEGAVPVMGEADRQDYTRTQVIFYGQTFKGANSALITKLFGRYESEISHQPDPESPVDYRVILGYDYEPCVQDVWETRDAPTVTPTPRTG